MASKKKPPPPEPEPLPEPTDEPVFFLLQVAENALREAMGTSAPSAPSENLDAIADALICIDACKLLFSEEE